MSSSLVVPILLVCLTSQRVCAAHRVYLTRGSQTAIDLQFDTIAGALLVARNHFSTTIYDFRIRQSITTMFLSIAYHFAPGQNYLSQGDASSKADTAASSYG